MRETMRSLLILGLIFIAFTDIGNADDTDTSASGLKIVPVAGPFVHAEGPHWDHDTQKLYFVDIDGQKICRFDPARNVVTSAYIKNGPVGFVIPVRNTINMFVAGVGRDFALITWDPDTNTTEPIVQTLLTVDKDRDGNRWNDGKADSAGRFWGGTIGPEVNAYVEPNQASLYSITGNLNVKKELSNVTNSNGLAWNLEDNTFYYIDTGTRQVAAYDYDPPTGTISNKRIAFDFAENNIDGFPDGMTIDTNGDLYVAMFQGGRVLKINPSSNRVKRYARLPAMQITSLVFGNPLLQVLYVTTSRRDLTPQEAREQPYAGYVFAVEGFGGRGFPANKFKLGL